MLKKQEKKDLVKKLIAEFKDAKGIVLSNFQGLPTKESQVLRTELRKENITYKVVKLTLIKRILRGAGIDVRKFEHKVPLALAFSKEDELAPARILQAFAKTHENLKVVAGVLDKKLIDAAGVKILALLPGKQELLAQVVGVIASPLRGFVSVLSGNLRGLVNALKAIEKQKA
jgi:large subunit ribosomal protein L10